MTHCLTDDLISRDATASKKFSKKRNCDAMNMSTGRQKVGLPKLVAMFAIASQLLNGPFIFQFPSLS